MHDEDTGLVYNRARMLSPTLMRFMQRDPAGYVDGHGLYESHRSVPVALLDPTGFAALTPEEACKRKCVAIGFASRAAYNWVVGIAWRQAQKRKAMWEAYIEFREEWSHYNIVWNDDFSVERADRYEKRTEFLEGFFLDPVDGLNRWLYNSQKPIAIRLATAAFDAEERACKRLCCEGGVAGRWFVYSDDRVELAANAAAWLKAERESPAYVITPSSDEWARRLRAHKGRTRRGLFDPVPPLSEVHKNMKMMLDLKYYLQRQLRDEYELEYARNTCALEIAGPLVSSLFRDGPTYYRSRASVYFADGEGE